MKVKTLSALAGLGGAMIMSSAAQAAPQLVIVSHNTTAAYLVNNGLQSAVIGVNGFAGFGNLQGLLGTEDNPWTITTGAGGFFNVDDDFTNPTTPTQSFEGSGALAATNGTAPNGGGFGAGAGAFDTGVLQSAFTAGLGSIENNPGDNAIGFAQFGVGQNTGSNAVWVSLNAAGISVPGTLNLFRLTWSINSYMLVSMTIATNDGQGGGEEFVSTVSIGDIPAPGALALLGLAGLVGGRRRRA